MSPGRPRFRLRREGGGFSVYSDRDQFTLLYSRNQHNIVKQLSSN